MEGVEAWRGGWGGYEWDLSSTSIRPSGASVFPCSVWPRGWAWPGERGGLWEGLRSPPANDRAHCTLNKSLWPINTTSARIRSAHMYVYLHTQKVLLTVYLKFLVTLTIHIFTHTAETHGRMDRGLLSYPTGPIRLAAWMMDCRTFQPSFLCCFLKYLAVWPQNSSTEREPDMKRIANDVTELWWINTARNRDSGKKSWD